MNGNGGTYGAATPVGYDQRAMSQPVTPRVSMVTQQVEAIAIGIEHLQNAITELEARLSAVTSPAPPMAGASEKRPDVPVPLAAGLQQLSDRLQLALQRLGSLNLRIEI